MTSTAAIAIYAALVATASLAWQVYTWWHRGRTQVEVTASVAILSLPMEQSTEAIGIQATNRSEHPVRVTSAGLYMQDESGQQLHIIQTPHGATIPGTVQPRDSASTWIERSDYESQGISPYDPVRAWVRLATGELLQSEAVALMSRD